jgi:hypothetical protein
MLLQSSCDVLYCALLCAQVQVECIYEPPQETTDTTFTLLPDSQEVSEYCLPSSFSRAVGTVILVSTIAKYGYHQLVYASLCIDLAFCVCLCGTENVWQGAHHTLFCQKTFCALPMLPLI